MPPRWRLPLLALGVLSLAFGVAGGLARLTAGVPAPATAIALHGALMVSAFFGTVISLERAVALGRLWAYGAPLAAGLGGGLLLAGLILPGLALLIAAAAVFAVCSALVLRRQPSLETATLLGGALAWLSGNAALFHGWDPAAWWIAFFALTIGAERLELSRYLRRGPWVRRAFAGLALAVLLLPPLPQLLGAALLLLALWLFAFDLARVTIRQAGLPRYVAACLLAGYGWLAFAGIGLLVELPRDATLHAVFLGFAFSMVFGHAPVILPAVLRVRFPYHPALYLPLALLHASLAVRAFADAAIGAWGGAAAIGLFIATSIVLVSRASSVRLRRSAPGR